MDLLNPAILQALLPRLGVLDALSLSRTCRALRGAVVDAWHAAAATAPTRPLALLLASDSGHLVLLDARTGRLLHEINAHPTPPSEHDSAWLPCLDVDPSGSRAFVTCHAQGGGVLEFAVHPQGSLSFVRRFTASQLGLPDDQIAAAVAATAPVGSAQPEGVAVTHGRLLVSWLEGGGVTAMPLGPPGAAGQPAGGGQAEADDGEAEGPAFVSLPAGRGWTMWGARVGPPGGHALYLAGNPGYESDGYAQLPPTPGRGFIARLQLDEHGNIQPGAAVRRFTRCRSRLSRPCDVCFDEAGDMYVPHLGLQVCKFAGPRRGADAGKWLGVFIDTADPRHGLSPDPAAERPCPFDMAWHQGILYLTTHTSGGGDESSDDGSGSNACSDAGSDSSEPGSGNGCLSLWDRQGRLVKVHRLRGRWRHPNGIRVFNAPR